MGLGDWYQERKEKKAAKKEAARLAAGQARQAAEEEKKRQQEAQAQQSMGYTRNYIQMLERRETERPIRIWRLCGNSWCRAWATVPTP